MIHHEPTWSGPCPICTGVRGFTRECPLCHGTGRLSVYGASTAIKRGKPSAPCKLLYQMGRIHGSTLDFGCGKCDDLYFLGRQKVDVAAFDPYHYVSRKPLLRQYDTVLCTYVVNVIPQAEEKRVLKSLKKLARPHGRIFVSVRRDLPKEGREGRGTWQRYVELDSACSLEFATSKFAIYRLQ